MRMQNCFKNKYNSYFKYFLAIKMLPVTRLYNITCIYINDMYQNRYPMQYIYINDMYQNRYPMQYT